jgi:hypothetical protein
LLARQTAGTLFGDGKVSAMTLSLSFLAGARNDKSLIGLRRSFIRQLSQHFGALTLILDDDAMRINKLQMYIVPLVFGLF